MRIKINYLDKLFYRLEEEKIKTGGTTNWRYFNRVKSLLTKSPSVHFEEILFDNTGNFEDNIYKDISKITISF